MRQHHVRRIIFRGDGESRPILKIKKQKKMICLGKLNYADPIDFLLEKKIKNGEQNEKYG
jgi:hypothetical protein